MNKPKDADRDSCASHCSSACDVCEGYKTFCAWQFRVGCPKCGAINSGIKPKMSIREIAERAGIDITDIQGEDIDVLTGKRTHND